MDSRCPCRRCAEELFTRKFRLNSPTGDILIMLPPSCTRIITDAQLRHSLPSSSLPCRDHQSLRMVVFSLRLSFRDVEEMMAVAASLTSLPFPRTNHFVKYDFLSNARNYPLALAVSPIRMILRSPMRQPKVSGLRLSAQILARLR
jgi:hypothetical protein